MTREVYIEEQPYKLLDLIEEQVSLNLNELNGQACNPLKWLLGEAAATILWTMDVLIKSPFREKAKESGKTLYAILNELLQFYTTKEDNLQMSKAIDLMGCLTL